MTKIQEIKRVASHHNFLNKTLDFHSIRNFMEFSIQINNPLK